MLHPSACMCMVQWVAGAERQLCLAKVADVIEPTAANS